jgi:S1-C subfamily serine protease
MASLIEWKVPQSVQPRAEDYSYDLERTLSSVVGLHSIVPPDAFTADTLGVERAGNGVLVDDGLVLTIGYLITEAETVWLHLGDGRVVQGHALGFDQETGFGLVQALGKIDLPSLEIGSSSRADIGERIVVGGAGGRTRSLAGRIAAKQEFAGYWEYVLEEAIFTYPAHPNWGGTALISSEGKLIGIGSLQLERARNGKNEHLNMVVPIDLLAPVLEDLRKFGRVNRPMRPWLGLYSTEIENKIVVVGIAPKAHARRDQDRRRRRGCAGRARFDACRVLSKGLVAGPCRRGGTAHALPRRRDLRRAGEFVRSREIPQGPALALTQRVRFPRFCPRDPGRTRDIP